ncbi:unnamed protein product [Ectocarpus sp. CCAP 1310/34]|nr:unnamed protein product [Ectocarpus sp. CCAP 1310/34]
MPNPEAQQAWRRRCLNRLVRAIGTGDNASVACALQQGGRYVLNERDDNGLLPIHRATIKAPASVVHLLIQAGADLEATFQGLASMHVACGRGLEGMVHVLLAGGANRDALTAQGFAPLHCASGRGGLGAVKALLTAGADVNIRSGGWERRTPLHAAATLGDRAVTEELLRWGADVDLPDTEGVTSLHIAAAVDNVGVARCLLGAGASTEEVQAGTLNRPLHLAAFQGSYGVLTTLLEVRVFAFECLVSLTLSWELLRALFHPQTAKRVCSFPWTLLKNQPTVVSLWHKAYFSCPGTPGPIHRLEQAGADFQATNSHGETPLHHACSMMDFAIVSTLLNRGADEAARDNNNHTCAEVLGDGLDEEAGGLRGDPAMRERILIVLTKAPAERAWRRRSWTVMMRAREANWSGELVGGGEEAGRTMVEICGSTVAAGAVVAKAVGARDEKQPCRGRHRGNNEGSSRVGVVGVDEEAFRSCVYWVVRAQEEGIFRLVVSFL